jgi:hypothetical protein
MGRFLISSGPSDILSLNTRTTTDVVARGSRKAKKQLNPTPLLRHRDYYTGNSHDRLLGSAEVSPRTYVPSAADSGGQTNCWALESVKKSRRMPVASSCMHDTSASALMLHILVPILYTYGCHLHR